MKNKVCTAAEAVRMIRDGDTITTTGFIRSMSPEVVINALEKSFLETGHPCNLTLFHGAAASEHFVGGDCGLNNLAHEGLITRAFSGFNGHNDRYKELIKAGKIEAYNFPLGVIPHLMRAYAEGKDGELTKIGMRTYIDPRVEGGRWRHDIEPSGEFVRLVEFLGEEFLYFTTPKPDVVIIRATTADEYGNLTCEEEALYSQAKVAAMAAKQNGGIVIAQVKYLVKGGSLDSQAVVLPGIFVDKLVICDEPELYHRQTAGNVYNPIYSGHLKQTDHIDQPMPLDVRKIMARRSAMELMPDAIVNLGTGNPEFVCTVAQEEGCGDMMTLTVEAGAIGGSPLPGDDFGATANAWAYFEEDRMFDLYDGGGLDIAFLGLAETDAHGNVNVSKFKGTIMGCGGFIEISQCTHKVVFLGTFTAGGLKVKCEDGKLVILQEGKHIKFKQEVEQITFSGDYANETGQDIYYVTERAVFHLTGDGIMLIEIAPGIDLEKDVLALMEFRPIISPELKLMNPDIFTEAPIGLARYIEANG